MVTSAGSSTGSRRPGDRSRKRSQEIAEQLHALVPGGAHTYARGDDRYPEGMAPVLVSGRGCRAVEAVTDALAVYPRALEDGINRHLHGRPVKPVFRPDA